LTVVAEVVSYGGYLPQLAELDKNNETKWTRKNGLFLSLFWFIFWVPLMTSILGGVFDIEILGELSALIGVFGSLLIFIYALGFMKRPVRYFDPRQYQGAAPAVPQSLGAPAHGHALPPQQSVPVSSYGPPQAGNWRDTNDLQPAVTESTTRMLDDDEQRRQ
jgi:predicted lipid-binding transport protein (Tim44 family)